MPTDISPATRSYIDACITEIERHQAESSSVALNAHLNEFLQELHDGCEPVILPRHAGEVVSTGEVDEEAQYNSCLLVGILTDYLGDCTQDKELINKLTERLFQVHLCRMHGDNLEEIDGLNLPYHHRYQVLRVQQA
jgi:hypothetical protein